jgi:hypothetical protein
MPTHETGRRNTTIDLFWPDPGVRGHPLISRSSIILGVILMQPSIVGIFVGQGWLSLSRLRGASRRTVPDWSIRREANHRKSSSKESELCLIFDRAQRCDGIDFSPEWNLSKVYSDVEPKNYQPPNFTQWPNEPIVEWRKGWRNIAISLNSYFKFEMAWEPVRMYDFQFISFQ